MTIRIHTANWDEIDQVWAWLNTIPDEQFEQFQPVEIHLDRFGPLYSVVRMADGTQTTARLEAQPSRIP